VIENAEGCGDADDPDDGQRRIEQIARTSGNESLKDLGMDSAGEKESGSEGHRDEQLDLMMEPAFVVEEADGGDERGAGDDAEALGACRAVERKQHGEHDGTPHREA